MTPSPTTSKMKVLGLLCFFFTIPSSYGFVPGGLVPTRDTFPSSTRLSMSTRGQDRNFQSRNSTISGETFERTDIGDKNARNILKSEESKDENIFARAKSFWERARPTEDLFKLPPGKIEDFDLLYYDVFLLLNLVVSISFWVVHRLQLEYVALAFNEGCLLSILWVVVGLYHGAFLNSAVDGNAPTSMDGYVNGQENNNEKPWWESLSRTQAGPPAAGLLALNTFINTISLRLIVALSVAFVEHRPVFDDPLEQLIPLEVGFGLLLMSSWRTIHSLVVPRV